jgi:CRISPR-associated protein Csb2
MFTVTVELLTGRYVATQFNNRSQPEWPPHPARLFSAAVAAWADHGDMDPIERAALEWWESLEPPTVTCSLGAFELAARQVVTHFVPVNDISVVARDTARTYDKLVEAEVDAGDPDFDDRARVKAEKRLEKARAKAVSDSGTVTAGIAPVDRLGILPAQRSKQGRTYPTMVPVNPVVAYHWSTSPDEDAAGTDQHVEALDGLLGRIPRLGHSSTPVAVSIETGADPARIEIDLEPGDARRTLGLRVPTTGQVESLIQTYEASGRGTEPRVMPARLVSYRRPGTETDPPASTIGERWILLEPDSSSRLMVRDIPVVAKTLRAALMSVCGEDGAEIPEFLSGLRPRPLGATGSTAPSVAPHLMVLGLPFAGYPRATGEVLAFALALPDSGDGAQADADHWALLRDVVDRFMTERRGRLTFKGGSRPVALRPADLDDLPYSARKRRWTQASTSWVSVTPVALGRNPGSLGHADSAKREAAGQKAESIIAAACEHIGLPRPVGVEVLLDAPIRGTRPVHTFPPARTGKLTRVQIHARLTFAEPVGGPVVLGAGRFHGLGLFAPVARVSANGSAVAS